MSVCTGSCASKTPAAGDRFLFRGGDTWHSFSTSPTGLPLHITWNGTSGNPIYYGVDPTWFNSAACGAGWCRPIFTGDNPLSKTPVSSCAHPNGGLVELNGTYVTVDNFEMMGICWSGPVSYFGVGYVFLPSNHTTIQNSYIHGWTHVAFGVNGTADGESAIWATSQDPGNQETIANNVIDGFDSDKTSGDGIIFGGYDIHGNTIRNCSNAVITNNTHLFYNNLIENIFESSDPATHSNGFEFNSEQPGTNFIYNNVVRHMNTAVNIWLAPNGSDYFFNNVIYDINGAGTNYVAFCGDSNSKVFVYNNTMQTTGGALFGNVSNTQCPGGASATWVATNNHFITDSGSGFSAIFRTPGVASGTNNIYQTNAAAGTQGYAAASNYAPTAANEATVGAGTNLAGSCGAAGNALCSDTTLANTRTPNARPASGAWDAGAYQFNGVAPPPPSGSACDVNGDGTTNVVDVQQEVNQALGIASCTGDINKDGQCTVVDVQRVVNAALGGQCVSP
jgi:hypothetical protein